MWAKRPTGTFHAALKALYGIAGVIPYHCREKARGLSKLSAREVLMDFSTTACAACDQRPPRIGRRCCIFRQHRSAESVIKCNSELVRYLDGKYREQLTAEERAAIMTMEANNCSARQIALTLRRAPSTITRELARFAAWPDRPAAVACTSAQHDVRAAGLRARRARFKCRRRSKLATDTLLFGMVQHFPARGWSHSQIAGTLKLMWPDEPQRTVSHESIYTCIYAMPKGELRKNLIACLRRAKSKRMPRNRGEDRRGQMADLLSINVHPPESINRAFPGNREGDLIKGVGNSSAVGVLVERSSRLVMLIKLPDATAASALEGSTAKLRSVAEPMRQTLTYDQGKEMARHAELTSNTGVMVYFCDPHSPSQRGSCENTNGRSASSCPRVQTCLHTARSSSMPLPICSTSARAPSTASTRRSWSTRLCWTNSINLILQFNKPVLHFALGTAFTLP